MVFILCAAVKMVDFLSFVSYFYLQTRTPAGDVRAKQVKEPVRPSYWTPSNVLF